MKPIWPKPNSISTLRQVQSPLKIQEGVKRSKAPGGINQGVESLDAGRNSCSAIGKGLHNLRSGCYLKCLTYNRTINAKSCCKDHEPITNLFKKSNLKMILYRWYILNPQKKGADWRCLRRMPVTRKITVTRSRFQLMLGLFFLKNGMHYCKWRRRLQPAYPHRLI